MPTVDPRYWTEPPEAARLLKSDPHLIRIFGRAPKSSGEPGYASKRIDFLAVRDPLDWSLPVVWHIASSRGETPMTAQRYLDYTDNTPVGEGRFDIEGVSHFVTGRPMGKSLVHLRKVNRPAWRLSIATSMFCRGRGWPAGRSTLRIDSRPSPP